MGHTHTCKEKTIFEHCILRAGATQSQQTVHGAQPPMWMICGDLNTTSGALLIWKANYDHDDNMIQIHQARNNGNKGGDLMISQGFSTVHEENTIGVSETSRKHASDAHNMVTLRGHPIQLQNTTTPQRQISIFTVTTPEYFTVTTPVTTRESPAYPDRTRAAHTQ